MEWNTPATPEIVEKTAAALRQRGIEVVIVEDGEAAKAAALALIPEGSEVMTMTSETVDAIGLSQELNSARFKPVRDRLYSMDKSTQGREMKRLGAAPEVVTGSVHAITESGEILIASATGSQLPAYAYGADKVIWVAGTQKIVPTLDAAMKRLNDYVLPLESERAKKAYGVPGSMVAKLLLFQHEVTPGRVTLILVSTPLGY